MKQGWEIRKLGDLCEFENGDRGVNYPSKSHRTQSGIPFINAGHLTSNGLDINNMDYISRERYNLLGSGKIQRGDILFCLRGSLGKFAKVQEFSEGAIASSLVIVRPKSYVISDFLMVYFESKICQDMISQFGNGAAQPNLSAGSLKNFEIPLPSLPEQQSIVVILDEVFAALVKAKANAEQNIKNAEELFESYLQSVFKNKGEGWEEKTLGEVCDELFAGGDVPKGNSSKMETDIFNIPIFSNGEKNKGLYGFTNVARVTKPSITISARGTIGYSQIRENPFYPAIRLIVVTPKKEMINLSYLKYVISSIDFSHSGSSIPQLTVPMIRMYPISFPQLKEQQSIVQKLDSLSNETKKLEVIYQLKINDLEELKKSILQKAFNGELKTSTAVAV